MISPTGRGVRTSDKWGFGTYGAPRSRTVNGKVVRYPHKGVDYICTPGQGVVSPINGKVIRVARPNAKQIFSGLVIRGTRISIKMFYFNPLHNIVGKTVKRGDLIGHAQDVGEVYPGITPHVHLQIDSIDPQILMDIP